MPQLFAGCAVSGAGKTFISSMVRFGDDHASKSQVRSLGVYSHGARRSGIWNMRKSSWIIGAVLIVAIGAPHAHADTITDYAISFTGTGTLPTSGSFAYDTTTNQFTSFTAIWDGLTFDFTSSATQTNYVALTGAIPSPLTWTALCENGMVNPSVPCDDFEMF